MKLLLTGGAGYVGSACLRWLLRHGHDPVAFDNLCEGNAAAVPDGRLVVGDILDRKSLADTMKRLGTEAVMHFAAAASVPESIKDPELYYRTNVVGTKSVLDAMRDADVGRILFSSTAATFGFRTDMPLREESPQLPETPYGSSKLAAEWVIKDYSRAYGVGYTLLRYFNACGADADGQNGEDRRNESHLIPLILYVPLGRREKIFIYGNDWETRDGTCVRDYIHVEDLALAHQLAVETLQPGMGRDYNMGSGTGTTVAEVLAACEEVVGRKIRCEIKPRRPGDPAILVASPARIMGELGWKPAYADIRGIVETAWRWHKNRPRGYNARAAG